MSVTLSHSGTAATADVIGRLCLDELYRQLAANEPVAGKRIDGESRELLKQISRDFVKLDGGGNAPVAYQIATGIRFGKEGFIDFCSRHYGIVLFIDEAGAEVDRAPAGQIWWGWDDHSRRAVSAIVMEPTSVPEHEGNPEVFNRWYELRKTMAIPDYNATQDDAMPFINHLMNISDGDQIGVMYFLNWLAQLYQFPDTKIPVAIFMYSKSPGVGKNLVQRLLSKVFGKPLVAGVSGKRMQSNFMDAIEHKRVIFINELMRAASADWYEDFKTQVSEPETQFEGKGRAAREVRNIAHYVITSNNKDALPMMRGDRRIAVLMTMKPPLSPQYYKAFVDWVDGPGPGIVANLLRTWEFPADWNPYGHAPQTVAAVTLQNASRGVLFAKLEEMRQDRVPPFDRDALTATIVATSVKGRGEIWGCNTDENVVGKALGDMPELLQTRLKVRHPGTEKEYATTVYLQTPDDAWWRALSPKDRGVFLATGRHMGLAQTQSDSEVQP